MHHNLGTIHYLLLIAPVTNILSLAIIQAKEATPSQTQVATPSQPVTLHINITTVNITWNWTYPDTPTATPTQFIIQIRSQSYNDSNFHNLTTPISELYYIYNGLSYGVFYQFRVIAVTNGHLSEPSENSPIFDNGMTAPPGPPLNLHIAAVTTTSILLMWSDPLPLNELKYLYHIYQGVKPDLDQLKLVDSVQENTQYTFRNLRPFNKYYFSVQADFGDERSILAPPVSATFLNPSLLPAISNISISANYTTVKLVWSEPTIAEYNVLIQTYSILYTPLPAQANNFPPPPDSFLFFKIVSTPHTIVTDLEQNTSYAFMIRYAFTINSSNSSIQYFSDYSAVHRTITRSSLQCVSCRSVSSTQLTLSWEVLKDNSNGGNQQLYIVTALPSIGSRNFTTMNSRGAFDISGLHPWTKYQMYIYLKGTYGEQIAMCPLTDCRTNEDKPSGYPTSITAVPLNSTAINISWSDVPENKQNGIILNYVVGCPRCPANQYITTNKYYIVTHLTPNQEYVFVIAAINDKGFGPDSRPVTVKTIGKKLEYPPTDVIIELSTPTFVILSWQPPNSTTSGQITQYTVTYGKPLDSYQDKGDRGQGARGSGELKNFSINTTSPIANLTGLTPNTTYSVSVSAWTHIGQGPFSSPVLFHTPSDTSCPLCMLNITVEIASPSRKCFNIILSWSLYGTPSNLRVVYYTLTLLSLGEPAFTKTLPDSNATNVIVSSDSLHSNHQYTVILEAHVQLDNSEFIIQSNSSVKTPLCTGVKTVVAVVVTSVCIVLALVLFAVVLVLLLKCYSRRKATLRRNASRLAGQSQMSRRFVVSNDYISLMKQQRGDGHSTTNTGSLSTGSSNGSYHETPPSLSSLENENEPLISLPLDEPSTFSASTFAVLTPTISTIPSVISSTHQLHFSQSLTFGSHDDTLPFIEQQQEDNDGYLPDDIFFVSEKPVPPDLNYTHPLRESPEGSSLSSLSSNKSSDSPNHLL